MRRSTTATIQRCPIRRRRCNTTKKLRWRKKEESTAERGFLFASNLLAPARPVPRPRPRLRPNGRIAHDIGAPVGLMGTHATCVTCDERPDMFGCFFGSNPTMTVTSNYLSSASASASPSCCSLPQHHRLFFLSFFFFCRVSSAHLTRGSLCLGAPPPPCGESYRCCTYTNGNLEP